MLKRGGRKRALGTRAAMTVPQAANQRWSIGFVQDALDDGRRPATRSNETCAMDFVHDQLATGRKLRMLTIVDFTFRGADVVEVLERVGREVGLPPCLAWLVGRPARSSMLRNFRASSAGLTQM
jgi:hypothetical protein